MAGGFTNQQFIERANLQHGEGRYCYDKVEYQNQKSKIIIGCNVCNKDFIQIAGSHIAGQGCPVCGKIKAAEKRKFTKDEFILRAIAIHGDKYDYSELNYINSQEKGEIRCIRHNFVFLQQLNSHLRGRGCPKCGKENVGKQNSITHDEFLKKSIEAHGQRYDYSFAQYINNDTKVKIICKEHGLFEQWPRKHYGAKQGCPICAFNKKMERMTKGKVSEKYTTEKIIEIAQQVHNNKYDYSKSIYINSKEKIEIICPDHGAFWQNPSQHLSGDGCLKCGQQLTALKQTYTQESFIEQCKIKNENKYDYSLVDYRSRNEKITIICPIHGKFEKTGEAHLRGAGCQKCSMGTLTYDTFVKISSDLHNEKFSYPIFEYINAKQSIDIICPEHGIFNQKIRDHLQGNGCLKCKKENSCYSFIGDGYLEYCKSKNLKPYVYLVKLFNDLEMFLKIGVTINDLKKRFTKSSIPYSFEKIKIRQTLPEEILNIERSLHKLCKEYKYKPLQNFDGETECFNIKNLPEILKIWEENISNLENHQNLDKEDQIEEWK